MGHFLKRGDAEFWDKEAVKLHRFLNKVESHLAYCRDCYPLSKKSILKSIRHFRKIFTER